MARTIQEIQQSMIDSIQTDENLAALNSTSKTAIWRLFTYVVALSVWTLETLFDFFKADVNDIVARQKPHTLRWYTEKAKAFQLGYNLLPESDLYNTANTTPDAIEASKVIKYAACVKTERSNQRAFLQIKIAGDNGDLCQLPDETKFAVQEYFNRIADAGVDFEIINEEADSLRQVWNIYYNPLVLDECGYRLDGAGNTSVQDAIKAYLKQLPFNGTFVPTYHIDAVQKVEGVVVPELINCFATYASVPFTAVGTTYNPYSGYLRFKNELEDLEINWIPQSQIL